VPVNKIGRKLNFHLLIQFQNIASCLPIG